MARLSRKHKTAITKIINRWRESYAGIRPVNYDRIRELINVAYSKKTKQVRTKPSRRHRFGRWKNVKLAAPVIHFLKSPIAFDIAQAVVRGRLAKKDAEVLCVSYGIDRSFVAALRRDHMTSSFGRHHWHSGASSLTDVWEATLKTAADNAKQAAFDVPPQEIAGRRSQLRGYQQFAPAFPDLPGLPRNSALRKLLNNDLALTNKTRKTIGPNMIQVMGNFNCREPEHSFNQQLLEVPWSSNASAATLSRCTQADVEGWRTSYMDAEIVCELMGVKDTHKTWAYELMREAHVVMCFRNQVLVCAERPTIHTNANGELHNDEGPAVAWADGAKQYYIDGHSLGHLGELIVDRPEQLTLAHINNEENEEIKRLAIEKYGWSRYLEEIGAQVLDRRENAVDNTIEALVSVQTKIFQRAWGWNSKAEERTFEQRKLVLSCRSTARQYFLAVPETVNSCEAGQHWMAEGANTSHVAALNRPVRVIGAS